jgi:hypothetical protein
VSMTKQAKKDAVEPEARRLRRELFTDEMLDQLMAATDERGLSLTGEGGFLPEMIKAVLERGMEAELTGHLGYDKGDPAGKGSGNSRNGSHPEDGGHRGRRHRVGPASGPELHVRVGAGAQGRPPPGRAGGHDHQPVRRRDDDPRHPAPPGVHAGHRAVARDDQQGHRRRRRGGHRVADPPARGVLPGDLPRRARGQDPRRGARVQPGRAHRRRGRHGRRQARPGDLGPSQPRARSSGRRCAPSSPTAASRTC